MARFTEGIDFKYDYDAKFVEGFNPEGKRVLYCNENDFEVTLYGKDGNEPGKVYKFYDFKDYCAAMGDNKIELLSTYPDKDVPANYDELKDRCDKALFDSDLKVYGIAVDEKNNTVAVDANGTINTYVLTSEQIKEFPGLIDNVTFAKEEFDDFCSKLAEDPSKTLYDVASGVDFSWEAWDENEYCDTLKLNVNGEERSFGIPLDYADDLSEMIVHKGRERCFTSEELADKLDEVFVKDEKYMDILYDSMVMAGKDSPEECFIEDCQKGNFVININDQLIAIDKDLNIRKVDEESIPYRGQMIRIDEDFTLNNFGGRVAVADVLMQIENKSVDLGVSLDGNPVQKDIQNCINRLDNIKFCSDFFECNELLPAEEAYLAGMQKALSDKDFKLTDFRSAEMAVINDMVVSNEFFIEDIKEAVANHSPFCVSKYGEGQADYLVNDCVNAVSRDRYSREVAINKAEDKYIDHDSNLRSNEPEFYYRISCKDALGNGMGYVEADKRAVAGMLNVYSVDEVKDVVTKCSPVFAGNPSGAVSFVDEVKAEKDAEKQKLEKAREKIREREKAHSNALDSSKDKPKDQSTRKNQNSGSGSGHGHSGNTGR